MALSILSWNFTSNGGFTRNYSLRDVRRITFILNAIYFYSDQLVTLTTMTPPKAVRITGITSDHGLLRTVPERTGWSSGDGSFIDLQPDGNSFDIMAGLIKSKN